MRRRKQLTAILTAVMSAATAFSGGISVWAAPETLPTVGQTVISGKSTYTKLGEEADGTVLLELTSFTDSEATAFSFPTQVSGTPVKITAIGENAFSYCNALESVVIPDTVTEIGESAFYSCTSLTDVTLPETITEISSYLFYNCTLLTDIDLPDSITSIDMEAFTHTGIVEAQEGEPIQYVDGWVVSSDQFLDETELDLTIAEGTVGIAKEAFYFSDVTHVTLPDSVRYINDLAFANTNMTIESLPAQLEVIGESAFRIANLTELSIPGSVRSIGKEAFYGCENLTSVVMEEGVQEIGNRAFAACEVLEHVTLPDSLTELGIDPSSSGGVFYNCPVLNHVVIPKGMTVIKSGTFGQCVSLDDITIPETITAIESDAFAYTPLSNSLSTVKYADTWVIGCDQEATEITIKDGTIGLATDAFDTCYNLTSVTLPEGLHYIGNEAFHNCYKVSTITIPESVKTIGEAAFRSCYILEKFTIPAGVESIGAYALYSSFESVIILNPEMEIPDSNLTITTDVLYGYTGSTAQVYAEAHNIDFIALNAVATGDVNGDNAVTVEDAVMALNIYAAVSAGLTVEATEAQLAAADIDGDGKCSVEDAVLILTYYAQSSAGLNPTWDALQ